MALKAMTRRSGTGATPVIPRKKAASAMAMSAKTARGHKRAMVVSRNSGGVTKEDLLKSAERIYCKYLIPQAETPIRIPGTVRHRVAQIMDGKMILVARKGAGVRAEVAVNKNDIPNVKFYHPPAMGHNNNNYNNTISNNSQGKKKRLLAVHNSYNFKQNTAGNNNSRYSTVTATITTLRQPEQDLGLVFAEAREIVFEGMESYYFPRFLKARAYGNMVRSQRVLRAVIGLSLVFLGFVIVLCLIFLNTQPRSVRAWVKSNNIC
jgi:hypothetical protein